MTQTETAHEARLMVNTSLYSLRGLISDEGPVQAIRTFAGRVAENAALIEALAADGWEIVVDTDESDSTEQYLYGAKQFPSLEAALAAARAIPGSSERTLGWAIGEEGDSLDEYMPVGTIG